MVLLSHMGPILSFFPPFFLKSAPMGVAIAQRQFADGVLGNADRQAMERKRSEHASESFLANARYWMEHELRQYPRTKLNLATLITHAEQLVLAGGRDSHDQMTYQPNKVLAQQFGCDIIDFPGGHLGFLSFPTEFAKVLVNVLNNELI